MHLRRHDTIDVDDRKGWKQHGLRGVEGANVCIGDLALFGELAALAACGMGAQLCSEGGARVQCTEGLFC